MFGSFQISHALTPFGAYRVTADCTKEAKVVGSLGGALSSVPAGRAQEGVYVGSARTFIPRCWAALTTRSVCDQLNCPRLGSIDGQSKSTRNQVAPVATMASRSRASSASLPHRIIEPGENP